MARISRDLQAIDLDQLTCRAIAHKWEPRRSTVAGRNDPHHWQVNLTCDRCGKQRVDLVDSQGRLVGRSYGEPESWVHLHAEDYGGMGGLKTASRQALLTRRTKK